MAAKRRERVFHFFPWFFVRWVAYKITVCGLAGRGLEPILLAPDPELFPVMFVRPESRPRPGRPGKWPLLGREGGQAGHRRRDTAHRPEGDWLIQEAGGDAPDEYKLTCSRENYFLLTTQRQELCLVNCQCRCFAHVRTIIMKDAKLFRQKLTFHSICVLVNAMPDKPSWYDRLESVIEQLEQSPHPYVDRETLEFLLGIGRRRAQQILQPLVRRRLGKNGLAAKEDVIDHMRHLAAGDAAYFRRGSAASGSHAIIDGLHAAARERPRVLVEAPAAMVNQEIESLPPGVHLFPGRIQIDGFGPRTRPR